MSPPLARVARSACALVLGGSALALGGCGGSAWESSYESAVVAPPLDERAPVIVREVPWQRVDATLAELEAQRAASDVHVDEWTSEQKDAAKERLLRGLQVSADPASVTVLGRCVFRTTAALRASDDELVRFARRVGATMVVWSRTYVGKAEVIEQAPVTEWRTGTERYRDERGRRRTDTFTNDATIWVPVAVQRDEHAWVAYFLRVD